MIGWLAQASIYYSDLQLLQVWVSIFDADMGVNFRMHVSALMIVIQVVHGSMHAWPSFLHV
jgi:hypothetical protein